MNNADMTPDSSQDTEYDDLFDLELDYEFDAPKFFDFTTPELPSEAQKADRWFLFAQSHAPSPLVIKLKWRTNEVLYGESPTCKSADYQSESPYDVSICSVDTTATPVKGSHKSKVKSQLKPYLPRSSTLLKPTASHLAKLNQLKASSPSSNGRSPISPLNHSAEVTATKRQKLENGYLKKAAQLRHQSYFAHKSSSQVISSSSGSTLLKPEVTVPKGPILETHIRARGYRSVRTACQSDTQRSKHFFKARPLNKKIFEAPLLAQPKKSTPCLPEFQEFHLRTAERAMLNSSDNDSLSIKRSPLSPKSPNSGNSSEVVVYRFKSQAANRKELRSCGHKKCSHNPPTELFSKLSLTDNQTDSQRQCFPSKDLKENLPHTLPPNEVMSPSKSSRCNLKSQCGYLTRSLKIH